MKYSVKKTLGDIEPQEVFLDKLARSKQEELGVSEKKLEVPLKKKISYVLFGAFLLIAGFLYIKVFYFQVMQGKRLYIAAENNKGFASLIVPERGIIYDKNLTKVVSNSPAFDLICERSCFSSATGNVFQKISNMAQALQVDALELLTKIQGSDSAQVLVSENLSHEALLVLDARLKELEGCQVLQNTVRDYAYGQQLSAVLGYVGRINADEFSSTLGYSINDNIGKDGIERYYEEYLRGTPGNIQRVKNVAGGGSGDKIILEPTAGKNLILNVDVDLQLKVYEALEKSIKNVGAKKGAAVAINPKNGAVLALVTYPSYDANLFSGGISFTDFEEIQNNPNQPMFNRAIQAQYPTGSTIKTFEAAGALQEKIISPQKQINDIGYIEIRSKYNQSVVWRFEGVKPHGWVDMREALAVSSNIYFYTVGGGYGNQQGLGPARIKKYLELFGWGEITGIDMPGEFKGFIPSPEWKKQNLNESWWDGDTYNLSIGQSYLKVTPLQVAVAYSAIANGGTLYKPQIVNKIITSLESSTQPIKEFKSEIIRKDFINYENLQVVREGMRDCVEKSYGSCAMLGSLPVEVAGKTGTAETGRDGYYNAWVSTFAPYENPEIVFVATIEGVEGLQSATLPVARDVLGWYFSK